MARTEKPWHGNPASTLKGPQRGAEVLSKPQTDAAKKKTRKDSRIKGLGLSCPSCGSTNTHLHVWFNYPYKHMCDTCQHQWADFGAAVGGTSTEIAVCADSGLGSASDAEEASRSHLQGSVDFAPAERLPKSLSCPSCGSTDTHQIFHLWSHICHSKKQHMCDSCQHQWTVSGAGVEGTVNETLEHGKSKPSTLAMDTTKMSVDSERTISDKSLDGDRTISEVNSETVVDVPASGKIPNLAGDPSGGRAHLVEDSPYSTGPPPDQRKRKHNQVLSSLPMATVVATTNLRTQRTLVEPLETRKLTRARVGEGIGVHMIKNPGLLNFPESVHAAFMAEHADWSFRDVVWKLRRSAHEGVRRLVGVKKGKAGVRYEAKTTRSYYHPIAGKNINVTFYLGTRYESAEEAGRAYDLALLFLAKALTKVEQLHTMTNFRPDLYSDEEADTIGRRYNIQAPQWAA